MGFPCGSPAEPRSYHGLWRLVGSVDAAAVVPTLPGVLQRPVKDLLNQWDSLVLHVQAGEVAPPWSLLKEMPEAWLRSLQRFNNAAGEYLNEHATDTPAAWLSS